MNTRCIRSPAYAELHAVSNFTFLRGASHPSELVLQAHALGYRALALTDECSIAGIVRAYEAARDCGLKLIVGSEFYAVPGIKLVALAPTQKAYTQICALISLGRRRSIKGEYQLSRADFDNGLDDCVMLWIPDDHPTPAQAGWFRETFRDRGWLAVELHRSANDAERLAALQEVGAYAQLPLVAAGDVHMHVRERQRLQDAVTAIRHGCTVADAGHRLYPNAERHLRTITELAELYPRTLLGNTVAIAERCAFTMNQLRYDYPHELVPTGSTAIEHLRALTEAGCRRRWPDGVPAEIRIGLAKELALIEELHYEHFFLTVEDTVRFARHQGILCQGRGSAANSTVCYALGITEVDPTRTQLLFERFLSKERHEPPDIDVDFEHERREEVIQYIYGKYGRERAALAATVITYQSRSAIRDVGKALGFSLDTVDRLAKSRAYWDNWSMFEQHLQAQGMTLDTLPVQHLYELTQELKGFPRHLSQHVGGFVIADQPLSNLVPIENAAMPERTIIQWDKEDLETLGLLKVDVLALGMLTAIRKSFDLLKRHRGIHLRMQDIPEGDSDTYDLICRADTVGVFQIESRAQMSMLPRLKPRTYYDLVIEVAIVRPGPIEGGMVHPYLQRRNDPDSVVYPSEALKKVLSKTLGVPIFQEQVMQIAIVAAGFTPGEADQVRRSMAAWQRKGGLEHFRDKLLKGMAERGYDPAFGEQIYNQIRGFGEYGFPESHAASFALLTYVSCWLKQHHPAAFIAALINSQPMGFYSSSQLLQDVKRHGVDVLPVDAAVSEWDCTLEGNAIRLGMRLIRGFNEAAAHSIVAARKYQAMASIDQLAHAASLSKRHVHALALAGAFRSLTPHRRAAFWSALGVERLPGMMAGASAVETLPQLPPPSEFEDIQVDYQHLGLSTGRHPMALLRSALQRQGFSNGADIRNAKDGTLVSVAGLVTHVQRPQTAKNVVFISLEDETGIINLVVWPDVFDRFRPAILQASLLKVDGRLQNKENVAHVVAQRIDNCSHWMGTLARKSRDFQ
jgi:error-prone DNA polymerase